MQDFGSWSDLLAAPTSLVQRVCLIYEAEAQHQKVKEWEAQVEQRWREQGLR
jgi:hypothetical protein